jgi:hypothetical protein
MAAIPLGTSGAVIAEHKRQFDLLQNAWREYTNVHEALKKQLLTSVGDIYLRSRREQHVGYRHQSLRQLLTFLMESYGNITAIDLGENETKMKQPWDPNTPFEHVIAQIDDAVEYATDGGEAPTQQQIINKAYTIVYNSGLYFDDCKDWDGKAPNDKTWPNFKTHFLAAAKRINLRRQTAAQAGFQGAAHQANMANTLEQDDTVSALANLAAASINDRDTIATMQQTIASLTLQLATQSKYTEQLQAKLLCLPIGSNNGNREKKETRLRGADCGGYCWSHGYRVGASHNSTNCEHQKPGHKTQATRTNNMQGSQYGKP